MKCQHFGICASCNLGTYTYDEQLEIKIKREKKRFSDFWKDHFDIIKSQDGNFRNRAEFRIWKIFDDTNNVTLHYAMNDLNKKPLTIASCSIVSPAITNIMDILLQELSSIEILSFKLFTIEFLSSTTEDILITLIYHKKLDESWSEKAKKLEKKLNIKIIGRSRKQKVILSNDYIDESLLIDGVKYDIRYFEGGFTQPNQEVNIKMIEWVLNNTNHQDDLCELYCGGGNFTLPLSKKFNKILATEVSKTSIKSAKLNCELNNISNIEFIRMSSEEFVEARNKVRKFNRMAHVDLEDYRFSTIFVDPPRAGLDDTTRSLCIDFDQIIYISCNPETLLRDLEFLTITHEIKNFALFDQFAFSNHIESGVILDKKK